MGMAKCRPPARDHRRERERVKEIVKWDCKIVSISLEISSSGHPLLLCFSSGVVIFSFVSFEKKTLQNQKQFLKPLKYINPSHNINHRAKTAENATVFIEQDLLFKN